MKLNFQNLKDSILNLMRRAGYSFLKKDEQTGEMSFVRVMGAGGYPRFHAYVKQDGTGVQINLHLDQKKPSYQGSAAHSGEYENEGLVQREAEMLKSEFEK